MSTSLVNIHNYFRASRHYFWCWAEEGNIVEWQNGDTLCYRDDLAYVLSNVVEEGLPPLGTLLLLLGACQERSLEPTEQSLKDCIDKLAMESSMRQTLQGFSIQTIEFLEIIQSLPADLRKGNNRIHLLNTLISRVPNKIPTPKAEAFVDSLQSGRWDELFIQNSLKVHIKTFSTDLENICYLYSCIPSTEELQHLLEVGSKRIPSPTSNFPEEEVIDLLAILEEDVQTVGLARLAKQLLAALHIPMRTMGASDLPLGGISDITNRGDFDRLLISELAQDQDLLSARLVNNEALYLRREEPPDQAVRERIILLDQTIRMWGIPRLFSLSVALALGQKKKGIAQQAVWGLGGKQGIKLDLNHQKGVIEATKQLDPNLHCGEALEKTLLDGQKPSVEQESFLITEEQAFAQPVFQEYFAKVKGVIDYVVLINRKGEIQFYQYRKANRKLLSQSKLDLNSLLFTPTEKPLINSSRPEHLPHALRLDTFPLLFPSLQFNYRREYAFLLSEERGLLCITPDQRLLLWGGVNWQKGEAAKELLTHIEYGDYYFGYLGEGVIHLLVRQASLLQLYSINLRMPTPQKTTIHLDTVNSHLGVTFMEGCFRLYSYNVDYKLDPITATLEKLELSYRKKTIYTLHRSASQQYQHDASAIKSIANTGYSILTKIKRVYVNESGYLCLNNWQITPNQKHLELEHVEPKNAKYKEPKIDQGKRLLAENPNINFGVKRWQDGSEGFVDSRGFLHLRSSNPKIPEILIVLAINMPISCWSSKGQYTGPYAFIPKKEQQKLITAKQFYEEIIQPFIQQLK